MTVKVSSKVAELQKILGQKGDLTATYRNQVKASDKGKKVASKETDSPGSLLASVIPDSLKNSPMKESVMTFIELTKTHENFSKDMKDYKKMMDRQSAAVQEQRSSDNAFVSFVRRVRLFFEFGITEGRVEKIKTKVAKLAENPLAELSREPITEKNLEAKLARLQELVESPDYTEYQYAIADYNGSTVFQKSIQDSDVMRAYYEDYFANALQEAENSEENREERVTAVNTESAGLLSACIKPQQLLPRYELLAKDLSNAYSKACRKIGAAKTAIHTTARGFIGAIFNAFSVAAKFSANQSAGRQSSKETLETFQDVIKRAKNDATLELQSARKSFHDNVGDLFAHILSLAPSTMQQFREGLLKSLDFNSEKATLEACREILRHPDFIQNMLDILTSPASERDPKQCKAFHKLQSLAEELFETASVLNQNGELAPEMLQQILNISGYVMNAASQYEQTETKIPTPFSDAPEPIQQALKTVLNGVQRLEIGASPTDSQTGSIEELKLEKSNSSAPSASSPSFSS